MRASSVKKPIKCESCGQPATVHLTHVEQGGLRKEVHLCEACAEKKNVIHKQELNLSSILQALIGQHVGAWADELARLACPVCGIKFMEFRAEGRLGCPHDYEVFRKGLTPLLQRIHRAQRHTGKRPRRLGRDSAARRELLDLRQQLREAVEQEAYERAAQLRDQIRQKEQAG
jgi:protein arginine kinase activator